MTQISRVTPGAGVTLVVAVLVAVLLLGWSAEPAAA